MALALVMGPAASPAHAQHDQPFGSLPNRVYEGYEPFEVVDTAGGNVGLKFTDLVLPGRGGLDVVFQRAHSGKDGRWVFGLAGLPLRVNWTQDPWTIHGVNGAQSAPVQLQLGAVMMTDQFWRFHMHNLTLARPDGTRLLYDAAGRLTQVLDSRNQLVLWLAWQQMR